MTFRPAKVISGGQTGVDRGGLDAARDVGIPIGGFCPAGRRAEDGRVPGIYPLTETRERGYMPRTRLNVQHADATLILCYGEPTGGTARTVSACHTQRKSHMLVDLRADDAICVAAILAWLDREQPAVLNVAGPRESHKYPNIGARVRGLLRAVFEKGLPHL